MITTTRLAALAMSATLLLGLAGCSSATDPRATSSRSPHPEPAFRSAACNLGARFDYDVVRATYAAPAVDSSLLAEYGPTIANDSCSDAQIIHWRELRLTRGENDRICRIVYYNDGLTNTVYPIGCAVPVVVSADASR